MALGTDVELAAELANEFRLDHGYQFIGLTRCAHDVRSRLDLLDATGNHHAAGLC